jgi:hypothetical protein
MLAACILKFRKIFFAHLIMLVKLIQVTTLLYSFYVGPSGVRGLPVHVAFIGALFISHTCRRNAHTRREFHIPAAISLPQTFVLGF